MRHVVKASLANCKRGEYRLSRIADFSHPWSGALRGRSRMRTALLLCRRYSRLSERRFVGDKPGTNRPRRLIILKPYGKAHLVDGFGTPEQPDHDGVEPSTKLSLADAESPPKTSELWGAFFTTARYAQLQSQPNLA